MEVVRWLAKVITGLAEARQRVLVGIDGPDAAGKTTLADRLAEALGAVAVRASIDGFHRPRAERLHRGELSPDGYYEDSFDHPAPRAVCLEPFLAGADRIEVTRYDYRVEADRRDAVRGLPARAVLVFDGVFLLRPELRDLWTLAVHLRVSAAESLRRARDRDVALFGPVAEVERRYRQRYLPGRTRYRAEADPESAAQVVIDNEDPAAPAALTWPR